MNRRDFLASTSAMLAPVMVGGYNVKAFASDSALMKSLQKTGALNSDRILVMIYLNGGNDGLNTVIPLEFYPEYQKLRSNIAIPENKVLPLGKNGETGLHPAMTGMQSMYQEGKLGIIHSVSYPNPSMSHIRSTDIYMTGSDAAQYTSTGWAGRYLDNRFPGYPEQYPNDTLADPPAIQISYINSTTLLGSRQSMGVAIANPDEFYQLVGTEKKIPANDLHAGYSGTLVKYIREQQVLSIGYGSQIKKAADAGKNLTSYSNQGNNELADQLKIVARLIHGGLQTKIYYVELGGFDTHSSQVNQYDAAEGDHARLLRKLSEAVSTFQKDLDLQGKSDKVIGMTFSDFGRRASSNASRGTDHGIAAPMFVFGSGLKRQVIGTNPHLVNDLLPPSANGEVMNQDIKMQVDFRRVYADILNDWFGTEDSKTDQLLFKNFKTISLFSDVVETIASGGWSDRNVWSHGRKPSPNDYVKINSGHIVSVNEHIKARNIQVASGGELTFLGNFNVETSG